MRSAFRKIPSLFVACVLALSMIATAEPAEDFAAQLTSDFAEPEMRYRPYARWWLAEGSHTDETLIESIHELYDAGYGGVEPPMPGVRRSGSTIPTSSSRNAQSWA